MRFVSLAVSRKSRRRIKALSVLLAILVGCLLAAEGRYAVLRVRDIEVLSPELIPDKAVWGTMTARQEACWPLFWSDSREYTKRLENYYPVKAELSLRGWGRFRLKAEPLVPVFRMYWGGKFWYVDSDGFTWLAELPENKYVATKECDSRPALSWGSDRSTPLNLAADDGNVYVSSLPVGRVLEWYRNVETMGWTRQVKFMQAGVREGQPVVRLIFYDAAGAEGVNMLFADDPKSWYEAALAVKKLYPDIQKIQTKIFIDTTYKGKILVKNIVK